VGWFFYKKASTSTYIEDGVDHLVALYEALAVKRIRDDHDLEVALRSRGKPGAWQKNI